MCYGKRLARVVSLCLFVAALAWTSAPAMADIVLSFAYDTLSSSYTPLTATTGTFTATHTTNLNGSGMYTTGSVTRLAEPSGKALFDWDPVYSDYGSARVRLDLDVFNINRVSNTAQATGTLELADIDGEMIFGNVSGTWSMGAGGQAKFNGQISGMLFMPPTGRFNGNVRSPGFSMDFTRFDQPLGTFLDTMDLTGGFFENGFVQRSTGVVSQVIPAPAALMLGTLGLAIVARLRRRLG